MSLILPRWWSSHLISEPVPAAGIRKPIELTQGEAFGKNVAVDSTLFTSGIITCFPLELKKSPAKGPLVLQV